MPTNVPFTNGTRGYLSIIVNSHQYNIPALIGTGMTTPTNNRPLTAGQGPSATYGASNKVKGIKTPTLRVQAGAMPQFFTNTFFSDLLLTRDANFDLSPVAVNYFTGKDLTDDTGKLAAMNIVIDRSGNSVLLDMTFLLQNVPSGATFAAYSHPFGDIGTACATALNYKAADFAAGAKTAPYGVYQERISFGTGAFGQKMTGGTESCDQLTNIVAPLLGGGVTVSQQAGAGYRLDDSVGGRFEWQFFVGDAATWYLNVGVDRAEEDDPMNVGGAADVLTAWTTYAGDNPSSVLVTAATSATA